MQKRGPTRSQKRILLTGAIIALVFVFVWLFLFLPEKASVDRMKTELADDETQIQGIESDVSKTGTLAQGIQLLESRHLVLENKFPIEVGESLKKFSKLVKNSNMKIISVKLSPKQTLLDENTKEVSLDGKKCELINVMMVMKGSYVDLIRCREQMQEGLPGFLNLDFLDVVRTVNSPQEELTVTWGFNLYFLD
jgi:hypothetical protein